MPIYNNVVELVCVGRAATTSGGVKAVFNVFHYRLVAGSRDSMLQLAGDFETKVFSFVTAQLCSTYSLSEIRARWLDDVLVQYVVSTQNIQGGLPAPVLPLFNTVVTPFSCADRGRSFRGSKHFAPIPEASQSGDELSATALTAWGAVVPKLQAQLTSISGTYQPTVLSRKQSQLVTNPTTIVTSDVVSVLLNKTLGTMRRRKEKTAR